MKVILILPSQKSVYSNLYEVYYDLYNALIEVGVQCDIVEVMFEGNVKFPFHLVREIDARELSGLLNSEAGSDTFFITVDDYRILKWIRKQDIFKNLIIWAHYFYGARYIFKSYRLGRSPLTNTLDDKLKNKLAAYVPSAFAIRQSVFYWKTLKIYPVFSQSIWTGLLLERVFNVPVLGNILIPVDPDLFGFDLTDERKGILVFLGSALDTDLRVLWTVLKSIRTDYWGGIDYFGNENSGRRFERAYGVKMNFVGSLSREELIKQYSSHFFTIAPIFNGNFEMVPIQSLLSGTPVITFLQPFMEVTGNHLMIANINNIGELRDKVPRWKHLDLKTREGIRSIILGKMNAKNVADDLLYKISKIKRDQWE